jgi:hypothetical protein
LKCGNFTVYVLEKSIPFPEPIPNHLGINTFDKECTTIMFKSLFKRKEKNIFKNNKSVTIYESIHLKRDSIGRFELFDTSNGNRILVELVNVGPNVFVNIDNVYFIQFVHFIQICKILSNPTGITVMFKIETKIEPIELNDCSINMFIKVTKELNKIYIKALSNQNKSNSYSSRSSDTEYSEFTNVVDMY